MAFIRKVCPVCALVALTWLTMLSLKLLGYDVNDELLAMLMGGSVVGITYVLGGRMNAKSPKLWKLVAIPIGFAAMYALLSFSWGYAVLAFGMYAAAWTFFRGTAVAPHHGRDLGNITKALDNCCE